MLESLHIENIAIIRTLDVDFENGFTVLTGETGAGKSIIIDSIQLLLGGKGDRDLIRNGEKSAFVSASFSELSDSAREFLRSYELFSDEDLESLTSVVLQRTLSIDGRSSARICGKPITIAMLREIGALLMTIHGQNDNGQLLRKASHLSLLDRYADSAALLSEYTDAFRAYRSVCTEESEYSKNEAEKARLSEILSFQIRDIDAGKLREGEEDQLLKDRTYLQNAEKISKSTEFCYRALKGSEKGSALILIEKSIMALRAIEGFVPDAGPLAERLDACRYEIMDIAESAEGLYTTDGEDPTDRLNHVEERLDVIRKLERKYGATVEEIFAFRARIASELAKIENCSEYLAELQEKKKLLLQDALAIAEKLTLHRKEASARLEASVMEELAFLDMPKVRFSVQMLPMETVSGTGMDDTEFLISTNPSEPPSALIKIASGGELSRIMLALRSIFLDKEAVDSLIFDDIDTGISGKTSQKVGIKLRKLSKNAQVICITHSPQIAALADHHFRIEKNEINGRNETRLTLLSEEDRVNEVARIIGGIHVTDLQRRSAKELIEDGKSY